MNQFQTLIWAQQLRKVARTRRTFQNSSVPWEKDRVVLGHILPRNIVYEHMGVDKNLLESVWTKFMTRVGQERINFGPFKRRVALPNERR